MRRFMVIPAARFAEFDVEIAPNVRVAPRLIEKGPNAGSYIVNPDILDSCPEWRERKGSEAKRMFRDLKKLAAADVEEGDLESPRMARGEEPGKGKR